MILFPDEELISTSDTNEVFLTSHRIIQQHKSLSSSQTKSIMLEHITSCQSKTRSSIVLLIFSGAFVIYTLVIGDVSGIAIAALLGVLYFFTRKSQIAVSSPTATILINTSGMTTEAIQAFIDKIEHTKHLRVKKVNKID